MTESAAPIAMETRRYRLRSVALIVGTVPLVVAACIGDSPAPVRSASVVAHDCAVQATDSARAICAALDTVRVLSGLPSQVLSVTRQGAHTCIITAPENPAVLDGMGAVLVGPEGRILSAVVTDSAACGPAT